MRRRNLFSAEQEREIYRRHQSGEKQNVLASEYNVSTSVLGRLIQKYRSNNELCPSGTASSSPAYLANGQDPYSLHVYPNAMQPTMHHSTVSFAQEARAISGRPFDSPSDTASSQAVPGHVVHGQNSCPPNIHPSGMQPGTHSAPFPLAQAGWAARSWAGQNVGVANAAANPSWSNISIPGGNIRRVHSFGEQASIVSAATAPFPPGSSRYEQSPWPSEGYAAPVSSVASNRFSTQFSDSDSGDVRRTHPASKSGKAIDVQVSNRGRRSITDMVSEALQIHTEPGKLPRAEVMPPSLSSSALQGSGSNMPSFSGGRSPGVHMSTTSVETTSLLLPSSSPQAIPYLIEDALKVRVEQRAALFGDCQASEKILKSLAALLIYRLEACEVLEVDGLTDLGFSKGESELLSLDDNAWRQKHKWVELFLNSLPRFISEHELLSQPIKTAIVEGEISGRDDFLERLENLTLPPVVRSYFRKAYRKLDEERQSETALSELSSVQRSVALISCEADGGVNALNDVSQNIGEHESLTKEAEAVIAEEMINLGCKPSCTLHSQEEGSGSHASSLSHGSPAQPMEALSAVMDSCSVQDSAANADDSDGGSSTTSQSSNADEGRSEAEPHARPKLSCRQLLFNTVLRCVPSLTNIEGTSGTMGPKAQDQILTAVGALYVDAPQCNLLDLGCSSGHTLACAATSGFFGEIHGVDLPENFEIITDHFQMTLSAAEKKSELAGYTARLREVRLHGVNAGDASKHNITDLLGQHSSHPFVVYWFHVGWSASDIINAGRILSNSPQVLCVAAVMRGNDSCGDELLLDLNANKAEEPFRLQQKLPNLKPSGGSGTYAAYIFCRDRRGSELVPTPALPYIGQLAQVLYDDGKWYGGTVISFADGKGKISFADDNDEATFKLNDPEVFFLPIAKYQWKQDIEQDSMTFQCKFCETCWISVDAATGHLCARCNSTAICLGCDRFHDLPGSICFTCRAELADLGRSQFPLCDVQMSTQKPSPSRNLVCYGCKGRISEVLSSKTSIRTKYRICRFCHRPFGFCCFGVTRHNTAPFSCPACVGALYHDAGLKLAVHAISKDMDIRLRDLKSVDPFILDEWGNAVCSLQINGQSELLREILPRAQEMLKCQVGDGMDPSIGPFNLLNLMVLMDGPTKSYELFQNVSEMYVSHARRRAMAPASCTARGRKGTTSAARVPARQPVRDDRIKLGIVTADMRPTPWWWLMKVVLIEFAQEYDFHIFSRPPCALDGDPYFQKLQEVCTIINFPANETDCSVAHAIRNEQVNPLVDAGGPTSNSFTGVMALRPAGIQIAHLGFPGDQAGGHIDWSIADQHTVDPDGIQGRLAHERWAYLPFYQPNPSFLCDAVSGEQAVPITFRSDWGLSEGRFVYALFCRLGRVDSEQATCIARILIGSPNSDLWLRATPSFALVRLLRLFRTHGIDRKRIVLAVDVPSEVHQERIRHADLGLDTRLYGAHTTGIDFLRNGVPILVLKGEWWHTRVCYGLVHVLFGNDDLVTKDLSEFEEKAIGFSQAAGNVKLQEAIRPAIQNALRTHSGIFDGTKWIAAFQRIIRESLRQKESGESLKDIYTEERIRRAPKDHGRESVFVLLDSMQVEQTGDNRKTVSMASSNVRENNSISPALGSESNADAASKLYSAAITEDDKERKKQNRRARECRLGWLFDAAQRDRAAARAQALEYIQQQFPALADNICFVEDETGSKVPQIQLPCIVSHINPETGNVSGHYELPLLFVVNGAHGRHLHIGQRFCGGMTFTAYDGLLVHSDAVVDATWIRSLSYAQGLAVDGRGNGEFSQMENNSLGHIANHSGNGSVAAYTIRFCRAPVSGYSESIHLTARGDGEAGVEVTAFYSNGSAARDHKIQRAAVQAGADHIREALDSLPQLVKDGAHVLRLQCGFDLHRVCGRGSFGGVIAASFGGESFAVKIGNTPYSSDERLSVLVEAAVMDFAGKFQDEARHGANKFGTFALRLRTVLGYPAALVNVRDQRVAVVAMELADSSARELFCTMGQRFRDVDREEEQCLLRDVSSAVKGVLTVVGFMHSSGLVHGDLKPDNILLRKLRSIPSDPCIAFCTVGGQTYQIVLCDWGLARWPGTGTEAAHVFSDVGAVHSCMRIEGLSQGPDSVVGVGLLDLQVVFGLRLRRAVNFWHPGPGTEWTRAPECSSQFAIGQGLEQRRVGQAGDVWAVGAIGARLIAAPPFSAANLKQSEMRGWTKNLMQSSKKAYESGQAALQSAAKRKKLERTSISLGSSRACAAAAAAAASAPDFSNRPPELWLEAMVRREYGEDPGQFLIHRIGGAHGCRWRLMLEVVQGLLSWTSEDRWKFAAGALLHPFFDEHECSPALNQSRKRCKDGSIN